MRAMRCILLVVAVVVIVTAATAQEVQKPSIAVVASGKVKAKADKAIVFMTVRSSSPLAADALEQNSKKVQSVRERLAEMGYKNDAVKFTGTRFAPAGSGVYYPGGQRPSGFDVYNNVFITLDGPELADITQFNRKLSTLLDELSKLGASPQETPISRVSMGGISVVAFTVKDPSAYVREASAQAMDKARVSANEIAGRMKVQITGVDSVNSNPPPRIADPYGSPLDEVPYEFISSSMDEVPIRVNLTVRYSFRQ